ELGCVAFSPDGKTIASAGSVDRAYGIQLWDVATGTVLRLLKGPMPLATAFAFSPDGKTLASAYYCEVSCNDQETDFADAIFLWDVATGKTLRRLAGTPAQHSPHQRYVKALAFSPYGKMVASGEDDHPVVLYEVATGKVRRLFAGHKGAVQAVAFSRDGTRLASAGGELTALLWDLTGRLDRTQLHRDHLAPQDLEQLWSAL